MEVSMSVWRGATTPDHFLSGAEGELISVRISANPRDLEDLLECLAALPFPVNPEIRHGLPTAVEFPAWCDWLPLVRQALSASGFDPENVSVRPMLSAVTAS
jgi:hypothetical protein